MPADDLPGATDRPVDRIVDELGQPQLIDALADLRGSDLTSLLLEVVRRRASRLTPAEVLRRYERDRFVVPAQSSPDELRRAEVAAFGALPSTTETLVLAPLVPLGTHRAIAPVDQNRVVTTARGTEVAADPTNALALEAALRRRRLLRDDPRSSVRVRLAASQRVTRAQRFEGRGALSHFQLFGFVTAGRDVGGLRFEVEAACEHIGVAIDASRTAGADAVRVETTDFSDGQVADVVAAVRARFEPQGDVQVADRPDRSGAGYYDRFCFKVIATFGDHTLEVADGGVVDWTQALVASRKERLMISGIGLDRLAHPHDNA